MLLGVGHTNAHILRMWGMNPIPDTDLTCISNFSVVTYSGFLPAVLAGQIPTEQMQIDLPPLCAVAGARLITEEVVGLDHARNQILFAHRPPVPFDVLSVGIGSVPTVDEIDIEGDSLIKIKPMQTFLSRIRERIKQVDRRPLKLAVVGGGVAGVEVSFCLPNFLREISVDSFELTIITGSNQLISDVAPSTRAKVVQEFHRRDVHVVTGTRVTAVSETEVTLDNQAKIEADVVIWATGAVAPPLLAKLDLPLDDRGFLATDSTLRSTSGRPVFAVGDTGTMIETPTPKAGVYAVRQGPVLWNNIARCLNGQPLESYRPQSSFLRLINEGNGAAIGQWKGFSFQGNWVLRLKHRIDGQFMDKYRPKPMMGAEDEMQCRGCGCKLGAGELQSALSSATNIEFEDAAPIGDSKLLVSTDFFTSPFSDPYLVGRVAALHCASDIICSGASVISAVANVALPEGDATSQKQTLGELLAGARREFDAMGAKLVGGHTIVGPRMEVGFTVIGQPIGMTPIRKSNLNVGDQLFLTKPLGVGIVLAAHMRGMSSAAAYDSLIQTVLERQHQIVPRAIDCGVTAGTDVTGFGLAGHLIEMLNASNVSARIGLTELSFLLHVDRYIDAGVESSLAPANRRFESQIEAADDVRGLWMYQTLFDPQTCGGLLFGVPGEQAERFVRGVTDLGMRAPVRIGEVIPPVGQNQLIVQS